RLLLAVAILMMTACGGPVVFPDGTTSSTPAATTTVGTTPATQPVGIPVIVDDCNAPQVGFSPLCETYQLIQEWHMDRPIDPETLADAASEGLEAFTTDLTETAPRTLFCAIPDPAFTELCDVLADRIAQSAIPVAEAIEAAVTAMAGTGLGQFSYYLPPELVGGYRDNGVVGGLGVLLDATDAAGSKCVRITPACRLRVVFVLEDNPGAEVGLQAGDVIVEIEGEPVDGMGFTDTATRLAGDETGSVEIEVERDDATLEFDIQRAPLEVPTVEIDTPGPGVGYLRIPDFEMDIPDLVRNGLTELAPGGLDRLVIDLRDNPGGFIDSAIAVAGEFIEGGVVVETVGPGEDFEYEATEGGLATDAEIAVLVNAGTASAAEILATALRDRRGAAIIGQPTFGKNAVQIAFELNNGGEFNVAVARWLSPNGTSVADTGVLPDRILELPQTMATGELADIAFEGQ
ncbi:MAG: S41 family peptidase, partial [Acidimicrobiia bacterium]